MLKKYWEATTLQFAREHPAEYSIWIEPTQYVASTENKIIIAVSNNFVLERIKSRYQEILRDMLNKLTGKPIELKIIVDEKLSMQNKIEEMYQSQKSEETKIQEKNPGEIFLFNNIDQFTQPVKKSSKIKMPQPDLEKEREMVEKLDQIEEQRKQENEIQLHPDLYPKYTFKRFVVGDNNKMAYDAAKRIIQSVDKKYNPVYIYGGVGLGKTHLMQAVGHEIHHQHLGYKILYTPCEKFMYEFGQMIRTKQTSSFRVKYRNVDFLLIDDIHLLNTNQSMQQELFDIFNKLKDSNKQMVFTCDRPIYELKNLTDRLSSRLGSGLTVSIKHPDYNTRVRIIEAKSKEQSLNLEEEIIDYIAYNINTNIRYIEAALTRLVFFQEHRQGQPLTLSNVKQELSDIIHSAHNKVKTTLEEVQQTISNYYDISIEDLKGKKRTSKIVFPRHIAIYIAKKYTNSSIADIGQAFGGRNHSTILSAVEKIENDIRRNPSTRNDYEQIISKLLKS